MEGNSLRSIPSVHELLDAPQLAPWLARVPRRLVVAAVREVLADHRRQLNNGHPEASLKTVPKLLRQVTEQLELRETIRLEPVINATGIIVHTGLGRAPLADAAADAMHAAAPSYVALEIDPITGLRIDRTRIVCHSLCELTGAAAACVVNNNAAALVLTLASLAGGRDVVISRGELIEIGGGFRLPEMMAAAGVRLVEVGTTNKTHRRDYERAIGASTGAVLKVHPSNFQMTGFVESVSIAELATLAHSRDLPLIHDIGSGALHDLSHFGLQDEPIARASIDAGADVVLFSGDKLLGGPQAGLIVGDLERIRQIGQHPLMRAMRVDKTVLAALAATLQLHRDADFSLRNVPVLAMMSTPLSDIRQRADAVVQALADAPGIASASAVDTLAHMGGGSLPRQGINSAAVQIRPASISAAELARRLRTGRPAVFPRIEKEHVLLDMRTVFPSQVEALSQAIRNCTISL